MTLAPATIAQGMLPAWLVLPIAGVVLLVIAVHVAFLQLQQIPAGRRRIRTACGLIMMFVTALLAYALAIEPDPQPGSGAPAINVVGISGGQSFVLIWTTILAMLALMVVLALADAINTYSLAMQERRALRAQLRGIAQVDRASAPSAETSPAGGDSARG